MRLLQFAGLIATLAGAYFAQYIFDHASLADFFPSWLLELLPSLSRLNRWLPADLYTLALWIALLSSLAFGLLAPMWQTGASQRVLHRLLPVPGTVRRRHIAALICMGLAAVSGLFLALQRGGAHQWESALWLISLLLLLISALIFDQMRTVRVSYTQAGRPERGWPLAVLILAASLLLMMWNGQRIPAHIPDQSALLGLQAVAQAQGDLALFAFGDAAQPGFSSLPLAAFLAIGLRPFSAMRWTGVLAGAITLIATWLLACELFRRRGPLVADEADMWADSVDDDGRTPALWSILALAGAVPLIHFGRLPGQFESVACGVLALWLLLRGARLARLTLLTISGFLAGWSLIFSATGMAFITTAGFLWVGLWLLRRSWLARARGGVGSAGVGVWFGALLLACSPLLGKWIREPEWLLTMGPGFLSRLQPTLLAFSMSGDASPFASFDLPMLSSLVAPLFVLAAGALLFRLDHLVGWTLITWLVLAVILATIGAPVAPWWPVMLPALPAAALAIGFALDRIHAMIGDTLGGWTTQAASYLAVGLLLLAGVTSWVDYAQASSAQRDVATALAQALDAAPGDAPVFLVDGDDEQPGWDHPLMRLAGQGRSQIGLVLLTGDVEKWPPVLPQDAQVFIPPSLRSTVEALAQRYPGGAVRTVRDLRANPLLHIYAAP